MTNYEVLSALGESIPDEFDIDDIKEITKSTSMMLRGLSEDSLLGMKEMERKEQFILQFYSNISIVAFITNAAVLPYLNSRMIKLSMENGICKIICF